MDSSTSVPPASSLACDSLHALWMLNSPVIALLGLDSHSGLVFCLSFVRLTTLLKQSFKINSVILSLDNIPTAMRCVLSFPFFLFDSFAPFPGNLVSPKVFYVPLILYLPALHFVLAKFCVQHCANVGHVSRYRCQLGSCSEAWRLEFLLLFAFKGIWYQTLGLLCKWFHFNLRFDLGQIVNSIIALARNLSIRIDLDQVICIIV